MSHSRLIEKLLIKVGDAMNEQELQHYGVVGMKWGVRHAKRLSSKGNTEKSTKVMSKHYTKAANKIATTQKKAVEKNLKAAKLQKKALKKEANATTEKQYQKARKKTFKANKQQLKAAKIQKKSMKFEKKMEKTFSTVKINEIDREALERGKKYTYMLIK
jgi:hypothetical protein